MVERFELKRLLKDLKNSLFFFYKMCYPAAGYINPIDQLM